MGRLVPSTLADTAVQLREGWEYHFLAYPADNVQDTADRAVFRQFQTWVDADVQGFGELVTRAVETGRQWNAFQPTPMVVSTQAQLLADMYGSGTAAGTIALQALISG